MNLFKKINNLSVAQVLECVHLEKAADGRSYVCPNYDCGHGLHGDGVSPQMYKGQLTWHCYGCGRHMSNSDLAAATLGINASVDRARAAEALSELFGLSSDDDGFGFTRGDKQSTWVGVDSGVDKMDKDNVVASEPKNFSGLYKFCQDNVSKFLAEHGGSYRALKRTTFEKYGLGIHLGFEFPDGVKRPSLVIPYFTGGKVDNYHGVVRSIDKDTDGRRELRQLGKNAPLYEPLPITSAGVNFIVESETDALSIAQVFSEINGVDVGCVATGGAGKWRRAIAELNERFANVERRPRFVVAFDNDEKGALNGRQLVDELKKNRYPATLHFFENQLAGTRELRRGDEVETVTIPKVDANDLLQQGGGKLLSRLLDMITQTTDTLDEQAMAILSTPTLLEEKVSEPTGKATEPPKEKPARSVEQSGIVSISLGEYFPDKFLLDVSELKRYAERKTGFDNLDDKLKALPPGLIVIGGLPATGKTTFSFQLAEQLAANGEYVFYCSYEMSTLELFSKSLARKLFKMKRAGRDVVPLSSFDIRRGLGLHLPEVQDAMREFHESASQLHIAELSDVPVNKLFEWLKPRIASATKSPVVIVDYLQIIPSDKNDRRGDRRELLDSSIRGLKDFQREYGATFVIISSLNRSSYWDAISLESFKETGSLEFSADLLLGLETYVTNEDKRKEQILAAARKAERTIRLACLKNRNGSSFECFFCYHASHDYFEPINEQAANSAVSVKDDDDVE